MSVIPLTLTISLCLVFSFVLFFILDQRSRRIHGAESLSLLPLAEETPRVVPVRVSAPLHAHGVAGHVCVNNGSCDSCRLRAAHFKFKGASASASVSTS